MMKQKKKNASLGISVFWYIFQDIWAKKITRFGFWFRTKFEMHHDFENLVAFDNNIAVPISS